MRRLDWKSLSLRVVSWDGTPWLALIALVLVVGGALSWIFLGDLRSTQESLSTTIRNVALVIGGVVAVLLAMWRSLVAERQATTSQMGLLNERYQKGAEMLGSDVLSVRMGGIYALRRLAEEFPDQYHIQVMNLLCAFVRLPTPDKRVGIYVTACEGQLEGTPELRSDVQEVMQSIGLRSAAGVSLERVENDFKLYLRDANLSGVQVRNANLSRAWLTNADLSGAVLPYANLSRARLRRANLAGGNFRWTDLSYALFWGANLSGAILQGADLSGADMCGTDARSTAFRESVRGLTQAQLDEAHTDPDNPPKLDGVLDADTGQPLVWHGRPRKDNN